MSDNPFKTGKGAPAPKLTKQEHVDQGNSRLSAKGRDDVEWRISKAGQIYMGYKTPSPDYAFDVPFTLAELVAMPHGMAEMARGKGWATAETFAAYDRATAA